MDGNSRSLCALTIAGSDSGGGAGIQADLKTFAAHRVHGLSAIAALTAQHTRGVTAVNVPPMAFLREQLAACFEDFAIGAVKLGMLANAEVIEVVAASLENHRPRFVDRAVHGELVDELLCHRRRSSMVSMSIGEPSHGTSVTRSGRRRISVRAPSSPATGSRSHVSRCRRTGCPRRPS